MNIIKRKYLEKNIFIFDWDGTLANTVEQKRMAYVLSLKRYLDSIKLSSVKDSTNYSAERISNLYNQYSGTPRSRMIDLIFKRFGLKCDKNLNLSISLDISASYKELISQNQIFPETEIVINELIKCNKKIYISSSSPQQELDTVTSYLFGKELCSLFNGIYGSSGIFTKGLPHVERIISTHKCKKNDLLFIGDDEYDKAAADNAGIDFVRIYRDYPRPIVSSNEKYITNLQELINANPKF